MNVTTRPSLRPYRRRINMCLTVTFRLPRAAEREREREKEREVVAKLPASKKECVCVYVWIPPAATAAGSARMAADVKDSSGE